MKKNILWILTAVITAALTSVCADAQSRTNMRINEVMVAADTTGAATGWVELFNSSYGSVAIEKMFLTTLPPATVDSIQHSGTTLDSLASRDARCYEIPRGDERHTKIAPRSHVVFCADANTPAGTFHLPFAFQPGTENYVALYDVNGALVDEVTIPAALPAGQSYAVKDAIVGDGKLPVTGVLPDSCWDMRDGATIATAITPGNFNTRKANENIEKFHINDPHGYYIALFAMAIVFSALLLLFLCFKLFGSIAKRTTGSGEADQPVVAPVASPEAAKPAADSGDEALAAAFMALYQHLNAHDNESGVLTFGRRQDSAWNSKAAMMRTLPERR